MPDLAINDPEFGLLIRRVRILHESQRQPHQLVKLIGDRMEEIGVDKAPYRARLEEALDSRALCTELVNEFFSEQQDQLRLGVWPENVGYLAHPEADALRDFVVRHYRPELRGFTIACVFTESIPPVMNRGRLGTALKLPGKMAFLSSCHAVVTLDFSSWCKLRDPDRQRLMHHELCHLADNGEGGLTAVPHDFEDFNEIIQLYGLRSQSGMFLTDGSADVLERVAGGSQVDAFAATGT